MIARFLNRIAARRLGRRSHCNRPTAHDRIVAKTIELQRELGWPDDPRLA